MTVTLLFDKNEFLEALDAAKHVVNCVYNAHQFKRELRRAFCRAAHIKQFGAMEVALTRALRSVIQSHIREMATSLAKLDAKAYKDTGGLIDSVVELQKWQRKTVDVCFPILAKGMVQAARASLASIGMSAGKASTASEWLESEGIELPPGLVSDLPQWMKDAIEVQLREVFQRDYWLKIPETTRNHIEDFLNLGLSEGESIRTMAGRISESFPRSYSIGRATNVARTESGNALNSARDLSLTHLKEELPAEVSSHIGKSWLSVLGNTTRDNHAALDGVLADEDGLWDLDGVMIPWPSHPDLPPENRCNCFPGSTLVLSDYERAMRFWYDGTITKIVFRSGCRLSMTPNHPVMTPRGFVPAGMLKPFDYVVAHDSQVDGPLPSGTISDDKQYKPAMIEEIFKSNLLGAVFPSRDIKVYRPEMDNFYGDAKFAKGNIEIVRTNRELLNHIKLGMLSDVIRDGIFAFVEDGCFVQELSFCPGYPSIEWILLSSSRLPCRAKELVDVSSGLVPIPSDTQRIRACSDTDSSAYEPVTKQRAAVASVLRYDLQRDAGLIFLDEVVDVRDVNFSGHVFCLESDSGLILASDSKDTSISIVTSNCQCSISLELGVGAPEEEIQQYIDDMAEASA